jgi:hypothetical protein
MNQKFAKVKTIQDSSSGHLITLWGAGMRNPLRDKGHQQPSTKTSQTIKLKEVGAPSHLRSKGLLLSGLVLPSGHPSSDNL